MKKFELLLKNEKLKLYYRFNLFIIIGLSLSFFYLVFFTETQLPESRKYILSGLILLLLIASLFDKRKNISNIYIAPLFFLAYAWASLKLYWLAIGIFFLGFLFILAIKRKLLILDNKKILYPSFPGKTIYWTELNNVILKDGLLTIDFKNNRLIQQMLDEETPAVNEKEFNEFCQQQLRSNGS